MEPLLILKGLGFFALGVALFLLVTFVVMRLWNWLIPPVFNGPRLRFVQALGLLFLTRLLIGGFGFGGPRGGHWHGHYGNDRHRAAVECPRETRETPKTSALQ
ncbi:hypothetical protein [Larkinella soli]|uniref:hypothetical protein n=1 Tax=Larkinella soli TaxID=1770527 RepID=UPI000FFBA24D|nr:hypothetical protein [Larkinella soli]